MRYLDVWVHGEPCQWKLEKVEGELTHFTISKTDERPNKGDDVVIRYAGHELEGRVYQVYEQDVFVYLPITFHPETVLGERRVFTRYPVCFPSVIYSDATPIACMISNISLSGCQVQLMNPSDWVHFRVGQTIRVTCSHPQLTVTLQAEIMRLTKEAVSEETEHIKQAEIGARYVEMDADSFSDIRHAVLEEQRKALEQLHPSFVQKIISWFS